MADDLARVCAGLKVVREACAAGGDGGSIGSQKTWRLEDLEVLLRVPTNSGLRLVCDVRLGAVFGVRLSAEQLDSNVARRSQDMGSDPDDALGREAWLLKLGARSSLEDADVPRLLAGEPGKLHVLGDTVASVSFGEASIGAAAC